MNNPISNIPSPSVTASAVERRSKSPTRRISRYATTRLAKPQTRLTVEDDRPSPRGFANGLWNGRPMAPATMCGMALSRNAPPKNQAMVCDQSMLGAPVGDQVEQLLRRAGLAHLRENPGDTVVVCVQVRVGHCIGHQHDVETQFMRLPRGGFDA